ncbi:MAG: alpha/beta hydrolase fold domain-containing protein [Novosphingobium sp.]|nr:alpha/beta hydrolase fold domain-containing protein [Novosphingobium sp.]
MASAELEQLIAGLRAGGPDLAAPPEEARPAFEALLATLPVSLDLRFDPVSLGGVPGLRTVAPGSAEDRALLYLHGGGYVVGSAQGYRGLAAELARAAGATGFAIDYRLAPDHRFPIAIEDAVSAYAALIEHGFTPDRIALAGDSAGGGLALALLVALRDRDLPLPSAALLLSPWTDLACDSPSMTGKAAEDPSLNHQALRVCADRYRGDADVRTPLASPLHADLRGLPPLLIQVGSAEILLDDAVDTARAAGAAGTSVRLEIWPDMPHVWHAFAFILREGRDAIAVAGRFLADHLGA